MHLAAMRAKVADPARPMADRERLALETAATLDRAAQEAGPIDDRRSHWAEAAAFLDAFNTANPGHPRAEECSLQAAVYLWARARTWLTHLDTTPTDAEARRHAMDELDEVIRRLRKVVARVGPPAEPVGENARFRLAQSLRDRSNLERLDSPRRQEFAEEALRLVPEPKSSDPLAGFAALLRSELLADLGRFDPALAAADLAAKATPAPQPRELLEAQLRALVGLGRFEAARARLDASKLDEPSKALLSIPVHLARRKALPDGLARDRAEAEALGNVRILRDAGGPVSRAAVLALARGLDKPRRIGEPAAWEALAEGHLLRGDAARAGQVLLEGADRAEAGRKVQAAQELRYRAAAVFVQNKQLTPAEAALDRILENDGSEDVRPKASLLRCVIAGKEADLHKSPAARRRYLERLDSHLREFPNDPTADEARWLLGQARLDASDQDGAVAVWSAIPRSSPRWLEARLAAAAIHRTALERALFWGEPMSAHRALEQARAVFACAQAEAQNISLRDELELAQARLELVPEFGDPEAARRLLDRLRVRPLSHESRQRLGLFGVALRLRAGRYSQAEQEARGLIAESSATDLLDLARLLDLVASTCESDLVRRRHGQTVTLLLGPVLEAPSALISSERKQAQIIMARALWFSGDAAAARSYLDRCQIRIDTLPTSLLGQLADTQLHLDAHDQAIATYRHLAAQNEPGSRPWLEARYGLALAYERSGQPKPARQILEATALLHPDLGGSDLRAKYERLRSKLGRP
jgi:TolA-binding protein